jgi:hypothetical protein
VCEARSTRSVQVRWTVWRRVWDPGSRILGAAGGTIRENEKDYENENDGEGSRRNKENENVSTAETRKSQSLREAGERGRLTEGTPGRRSPCAHQTVRKLWFDDMAKHQGPTARFISSLGHRPRRIRWSWKGLKARPMDRTFSPVTSHPIYPGALPQARNDDAPSALRAGSHTVCHAKGYIGGGKQAGCLRSFRAGWWRAYRRLPRAIRERDFLRLFVAILPVVRLPGDLSSATSAPLRCNSCRSVSADTSLDRRGAVATL